MTSIRKLRKFAETSFGGGGDTRTRTRFTPEFLEKVRDELIVGAYGVKDKIQISDDQQTGLRALVRATGLITFHAHYRLGEERPNMKVGHYPVESQIKKNKNAGQKAIDDARKVTAAVISLAKKGIDVQDGLHERLWRELLEQGDKWRPK